jgi:hypothetical protein
MGILFFNWYGYQLLSTYLQDRADRRLEASLDRNTYDGSQLISLKIPITSLSYYNPSTGFERVNGQIEIGGIQYKYVSRRIFGDSLEYRCIPNQAAVRQQTATNEFFRQVNDLQQQATPGKKSPASSGVYKGFAKEYCSIRHNSLTPGIQNLRVIATSRLAAARLPSRYAPISENPPEPDQDSSLS